MMENTTVVAGKSGIIEAEAKLVIKDFVEVMARFKPGKSIESDKFMVGDTPMAIEVYPNGLVDKDKGYVSLFLLNYGDEDIHVKGQLITDLDTLNIDYTETVDAGGLGWGHGEFLTHAECADAYKDKDFVVTAKLETDSEVVKIVGGGSNAKKRKFDVWENVHNKMDSSDFTLVFNGEEVPCHKIVLAAASPVLEAMVKNKHREAVESRANIKLSAEVGRAFVRYIYTGELEQDVLKENAPAFLNMGEMYNLEEMKEKAEKELLSQLEKENMVDMISLGEAYRAEDIFEAALKMTKVNMTWLRNQVFSILWKNIRVTNFFDQDGGMEEVKKLSKDTLMRLL